MIRRTPTRLLVGSLVQFALFALFAVPVVAAAPADPAGDAPRLARVELRAIDAAGLERLGIDVDRHDRIQDGWARVYIRTEQVRKLHDLGVEVEFLYDDAPRQARLALERAFDVVEAERGSIPAQYHTYETLTADLQQIAADHADIVRLSSVGQSIQGRELWMVKLTDNPDVEEYEPEFSYISSMHGDEVVGKEMLFHLLDYLTTNYGTDARVTDLVDSTEIWIMPSMNPDGTVLGQRGNANFVDLNRDFPDQFVDPVNTAVGREVETGLIMAWKAGRTIDMSSNFHGGELVANYPLDSNPAGTSTFSPAPDPDHPTFLSIARTYADNNPPMFAQNGGSFVNGVTNGADWYSINGGMQDWGYVWYGGFEVLMELSLSKWPSASTLPTYWSENLESMLAYMERVHEGVRGLVTDAESGEPLAATIQVDANPFVDYTDPDVGDYHRLLSPGTYTLTASAFGYEPEVIPGVGVLSGPATVVNVTLTPSPVNLQVADVAVLDGLDGFLDPGESAALDVMLTNVGRSATGVVTHLIPTGFDATVMQPDAAYPDIPLGTTAAPLADGYGIAAAAAAPEGRRLGFAVEWATAQGAGVAGPFFVTVGQLQSGSSASADVPKTITTSANVTVVSTLEILSAEAISNLTSIEVALDLSHTYIGDLEIDLMSPGGTTVRLHDHTGGSSNDIVGTYGLDLTAAQSLGAFLGENSLGTWTLTITDTFSADGGTLNAWSLALEGRAADPGTPEIRLRDVTHAGGGLVGLTWWAHPDMTSYRVYRSTDPSSPGAFLDVTGGDPDATDTSFDDATADPVNFYLVTGVGPNGEGPKGHFGE